jgi:hypothetical protein
MEVSVVGLETIEAEWIKLGDILDSDSDRIAGPFLSVAPTSTPCILYVGQATAGDWNIKGFRDYRSRNMEERLEERHKSTENFLTNEASDGYSSPFWRHARLLSVRAAEKWNQKIEPLQNLAWTNICKIGAPHKNPSAEIRKAQRSIAVETIRSETELYRPTLIYFVTGDFEGDLVNDFVADPDERLWQKKRSDESIWWRQASGDLPAILWTDHPQYKRKELCESWLELALKLLPA